MIAYASTTGNTRNKSVLFRAGWRLLLVPNDLRPPGDFRYGLDNGAWSAHTQGLPFDEAAFLRAVELYGAGADWIALPDMVAGGLRSLDFSLRWRDRLAGVAPLLLPVQDGMTPSAVRALLGPSLGIFVGGSTEFKLGSMPLWGKIATEVQCWLHVGRVNTVRRIRLCAAAGAHSFDGTSVSRYAVTLPKLDNAARQPDLFSALNRVLGTFVHRNDFGLDD